MGFSVGGRLELRISPSDVGKRVSVRSHLTGPGAGARFSDTVGVLTSWASGELLITRRDGTRVRLAETALAAGKVVPAAPARRPGLPAASVDEMVAVQGRGWPAWETERVGGWVCRAAGGWTGRANSARPVPHAEGGQAPGAALTAVDLERIAAWYTHRGLPPLLHLTTGAAGSQETLDAELEERGWTAERPALTRVRSLAPLADRAPDTRVRVGRELTDEWLAGYPNAARDLTAARRVLAGGPSVRFAVVPGDGPERPAAVGRLCVDGRWAGFAAIEVDPGHRRQGLARSVMAELARTALAEGASAAYLEVTPGNEAANALYDQLGFSVHHHYHYRRGPAPD